MATTLSFSIARVSAAVIKMQVRVDDNIDFAGVQTVIAQAVVEERTIEAVNVAQFLRHLRARCRFPPEYFFRPRLPAGNSWPAHAVARVRPEFFSPRIVLGITPNIAPPSSETTHPPDTWNSRSPSFNVSLRVPPAPGFRSPRRKGPFFLRRPPRRWRRALFTEIFAHHALHQPRFQQLQDPFFPVRDFARLAFARVLEMLAE